MIAMHSKLSITWYILSIYCLFPLSFNEEHIYKKWEKKFNSQGPEGKKCNTQVASFMMPILKNIFFTVLLIISFFLEELIN